MDLMSKLQISYVILGLIWVAAVAAVIISSKLKDRDKKEDQAKETNKEPPKKVVTKQLPPHLAEYYEALERGDKAAMIEALTKNVEECPSRNGFCMTEVFCPECPLANGGLSVRSYREGM